MIAVLHQSNAIRRALREIVQQEEAALAAPYWGASALVQIGLNRARPGLRVICNLPSGLCEPRAVDLLLNSGASVRSLSTLHAKVFIGSNKALVGSANVSQAALQDRNREVCVELNQLELIAALRTWFTRTWDLAADLSNPEVRDYLLQVAVTRWRAGKNR